MRGKDEQQVGVFSYVNPEQRVPQDHPLRPLRVMTDEALGKVNIGASVSLVLPEARNNALDPGRLGSSGDSKTSKRSGAEIYAAETGPADLSQFSI